MSSQFSTLIFDLGDVLFKWSAQTATTISPRTLKEILSSTAWQQYECGELTQAECYGRASEEQGISVDELERAFDQARQSLTSNVELIAAIHDLKAQSGGRLKVFAMSNMSAPDYEYLRTTRPDTDWSIFDRVFTSAAAGTRKPHLGFYRHVLKETGVDPRTTIFVDDKPENILSARSFGIHGIVFDDQRKVIRALRNLVGDPAERGRKYLRSRAGLLDTNTSNGFTLKENFSQLLIFEATKDRSLINIVEHPRAWNFFIGKPLLTTAEYPCDMDTTSLALHILQLDPVNVNSVMDEMLEYLDRDGVIQTYFDHRRARIDPVVCTNVLSLFYAHGRGADLSRTLEWVTSVLLNRAYLDGTRYYTTAECFLFFIDRLLASTSDAHLHATLGPLLRERVVERIGCEGDALALAMRISVCARLGIRDEVDMRMLLPLQCEDGGWDDAWVYQYGMTGIKIGNRGLTTALAINAVEAMARCEARPSGEFTRTTVPSPEPTPRTRRGSFRKSWLKHFWRRSSVDMGAPSVAAF